MMKAVAYYRASTAKQGASGLGIQGQRAAVIRHLDGVQPIAEFVEVESGKKSDRPQLARALAQCRRAGAMLVVAKLDRLARNVRFLSELMESGVEFVACDNPNATRLTLHILAAVAEEEARLISERTRAALAAAKERGVKLGNPNGGDVLERHREAAQAASAASRAHAADQRAELWRDDVESMLAAGMGNKRIAAELNDRGEPSVSGGRWTGTAVRRLRQRLGLDRVA